MRGWAIDSKIAPMPFVDVNCFNVPAFSVFEDRDGRLRYDGFNAAGAEMTGIRPADWIGREPSDRLSPDMAERVTSYYRRCLSEGTIVEYEDEFDQPAGRLWWRTTIVPIVDLRGQVTGLVGFGTNVTLQKQAEAELRDAAFIDPLTGAANRRGFERAFEKALDHAAAGGNPFTIVIADVDRFKIINDQHGHAMGDCVLAKVALRLRAYLRDTDIVARIGGDEFAVIALGDGDTQANAKTLVTEIDQLLTPSLVLGEMRLAVRVSLGEATWRPGMTSHDLLAEADARMYNRKKHATPTPNP